MPGVRFYFRYDSLSRHPKAVFEGVLPLKIKDEVFLKDWVYAVVVPETYRRTIEPHVSEALRNKVRYVYNDCKDIWEWSEKVYEEVRNL